ncbi:hemerythrin HHE cation binding domain-containing protein, partial [Geopyxis carbonaria]
LASISDAITTDHRELETYYHNIINATDADTAVRWQNQFVWELARHSIGEELVLYPAFEKILPNGLAMADKDREQHAELKMQLKDFQQLYPDDAAFRPTLDGLWAQLKVHIKEEEASDLPQLENALAKGASEESESLAKSFERTKMFVPSRSHPNAPDRPPWETVVGLLAAPIDKLRDVFTRFP